MTKFSELINNRLCFLFGAWASYDYGFPKWTKLQKDVENLLNIEKTNTSSVLYSHSEVTKEIVENVIKEILTEEWTLDSIVSTHRSKPWWIKVFRYWVWKVLIKAEEKDKKSNKSWRIEDFADLFSSEILAIAKTWWVEKLFSNMNIITLNYERLFQYRFWNRVFSNIEVACKNDFDLRELYLWDINDFAPTCSQFFPHWIIADFPPYEKTFHAAYNAFAYEKWKLEKLAYWDVSWFDELSKVKLNFPRIYPIDILEFSQKNKKNITYWLVNSILRSTWNIIVAWVSQDGIDASKIDFTWFSNKKIFIQSRSKKEMMKPDRYDNSASVELIPWEMNQVINFLKDWTLCKYWDDWKFKC